MKAIYDILIYILSILKETELKQIYIQKNAKRLSEYLTGSYPLLKTGTLNKFLRNNKIKVNLSLNKIKQQKTK